MKFTTKFFKKVLKSFKNCLKPPSFLPISYVGHKTVIPNNICMLKIHYFEFPKDSSRNLIISEVMGVCG